jgi:hypothetical protein
MNMMAADLLRTVWFSRGWTFQEFLFSRRKIVFHNNTVNWECHCASSHEHQQSLCMEPCPRPSFDTSLGVDIEPWPNFHRYSRLAALFTTRYFTYPEDALDAFAGASTAFARTYAGGLVTGLPQMIFDAAMIWQPYQPLQRRKAAIIPPGKAVLPSWSWVSWQGNVQSESWQSGYDYLRRQPGFVVEDVDGETPLASTYWPTFSTVQWYHSATLTSTRHPILVRAAEWRQTYMDKNTSPPPGWWRHVDKKTSDTYFTHDSLPDHEFWYPIPIATGSSPQGSAARSRYLHCKTRHAQLNVAPKSYHSSGTGCAVAELEDPEGGLAGCLRLNDIEQNRRGRPAEACHVIELSAGMVSLDVDGDLLDHPQADIFDEWFLPSWSQMEGVYQFYNVMQIEWNNGLAYRVAVGRVEKTTWERVAMEDIEVTIG